MPCGSATVDGKAALLLLEDLDHPLGLLLLEGDLDVCALQVGRDHVALGLLHRVRLHGLPNDDGGGFLVRPLLVQRRRLLLGLGRVVRQDRDAELAQLGSLVLLRARDGGGFDALEAGVVDSQVGELF